MDDIIASKPTRYRGTAFRSRLEARWAAFFDLAGWRWEYEPFDLKGWVPDFALIGADSPVLVEVKPVCWTGDDAEMLKLVRQCSDLDKARRLAELSLEQFRKGYDGSEILVVGAYPHYRSGASGFSDCWLGVFLSEAWGECDAACFGTGYKPHRLDFRALYGSYGYRMGGEQDGNGHLKPVNIRDLESAWRDAGNAVQWQPEAH